MTLLSIHMDRIVNGQAVNHFHIVYNDIDGSEFDHFPAKTFATITAILRQLIFTKQQNHPLTFGHTRISDSINSHERISPSHRVLFLSK